MARQTTNFASFQCIRLKNISLRVRRPIVDLMAEVEPNSALLDVFVIGTNAQEQLGRFFKLTNILDGQQDLIKLSNRMEMLDFKAPKSIIKTDAGELDKSSELISDKCEQANKNDDDHHHQRKESNYNSPSCGPKLSPVCSRLRRSLREFGRISDEAKLQNLLSIYEKISSIQAQRFQPPDLRCSNGKNLHLLDAIHLLIRRLNDQQDDHHNHELVSILCRPEFHSVCQAFDGVRARLIKRDNASAVIQAKNQTQEEQTSLERVVCIQKNSSQALGATIKNDPSGRVLIGRIIKGGVAHTSGLLNEADELLEVNGVPLAGMDINQVIELLNEMEDSLVFRIKTDHKVKPETTADSDLFVRTHFDFDPDEQADFVVPCKELSLAFASNEILQVIDKSDRNWWQARRVDEPNQDVNNDDHHLPGLIPSPEYLGERQDRRAKQTREEPTRPAESACSRKENLVLKLLFNCPRGSSPKRRKSGGQTLLMDQQEWSERSLYEQVILVKPSRLRPILLFGPKLIGQNELIRRLLQSDGGFSSAVSHTTRPMKSNEINGVDFHFVSRNEFELKVNQDEFIEFGSYQNQLYGTSIEAVKQVMRSQKICVQSVNFASLLSLKNGRAGRELRPIFVLVKPDPSRPDRLRQVVMRSSQRRLNVDERIRSIWTEVDLIESNYLANFDLTLTMSDAQEGYELLMKQLDDFHSRGQWIPIGWQRSDQSYR